MTTQRANVLLRIVVVILTATLLIPMLRNMQAKSAREESIDHLKSMGLALHNFESIYKRIPPAFDVSKSMQTPASVHVHLLPCLEEDKLFQTFHFGKGNAQAIVTTFLAPSDGTLGGGAGVQNFAANLRLFSSKGYSSRPDEDIPSLSPIEPGANLPLWRLERGESDMIAFAEKMAVCGEGGSHFAANPTSPFAAFFGQSHAEIRAHPKDHRATFQLAPRGDDCCTSPLMAQSFESKGILVGLTDASVRYVRSTISPEVWNLAISR